MLISAGSLATYSEGKNRLYETGYFKSKDGLPIMFSANIFASLVANTVSIPVDVIKSRLQNMPVPKPGEAPMYTGVVDCVRKSIAAEGPMVLASGFTPAFIKLAPYNCISLILVDKLSKLITGKAAM